MICQITFIKRIIKNDLFYECSDEITNEVLNQENKNTKKTKIYTAVNLAADILISIHLVCFIIAICCKEGGCCSSTSKIEKIENESKFPYKIKNNEANINNIIFHKNKIESNRNFITIIRNLDKDDDDPKKLKINNNIIVPNGKIGESNSIDNYTY